MPQVRLTAREYKLLLNPRHFESRYPGEVVTAFWEDDLKPIIDRHLDRRESNEPRSEGAFEAEEERRIRFWDTESRLLTRCDYSLRERSQVLENDQEGPDHELSLKLRTADLFIAIAAADRAVEDHNRISFEEDIAPLEVTEVDARGDRKVTVADPPTIRSRFSMSLKQVVSARNPLDRLGHLLDRFPGLAERLGSISERTVRRDAALIHGQEMRERCFEGAEVRLGDNIKASFTFTLWYPEETLNTPRVAEISFKYKVPEREITDRVPRRALALFTFMQKDLGKLVNLRDSSKTALALPN
jgi:hypothetical protein